MAISDVWELPEAIKKRLGHKTGRQRAMFAGGHLLVILHKVPTGGVPEREGIYFWRQPDGSWKASERDGNGLALLREHVEEYGQKVDQLEELFVKATTSDHFFDILEDAMPLQRAAKNMHTVLQQAREAVEEDIDLIDVRDRSYDISRAAELLHGEAKSGLEYNIAKQTEEQARVGHSMAVAGHRLNIMAAIFFPLTAVASVFGMNLRHGLEEAPLWVFWLVFAAGILTGWLVHVLLIARKSQ